MNHQNPLPVLEKIAGNRVSPLASLLETGQKLFSQRKPEDLQQAALEGGLALSGAAFGAFFSEMPLRSEGRYEPTAYAGAFLNPFRSQEVQQALWRQPPFSAAAPSAKDLPVACLIVRSSDLTVEPGFAPATPPAPGSTMEALRSYLAVPVCSSAGHFFGVLAYGHANPGAFLPEVEPPLAAVAAQTALALENLSLRERLSSEIATSEAARSEQRIADRRLEQALEAGNLGTWSWEIASGMVDLDQRAASFFGQPPHVPIPRKQLRTQIMEVERSPTSQNPDISQGLHGHSKPYLAEYRIRSSDGTLRWLLSHGNATCSPDSGKVIGMVGTLQDITFRRVQEASLRQSEKLAATGRLAASIAHEINNPLEAITNLIYLAKTDPLTPPSVQRLLETADSELERVSHIAQQTLGFYRDTTRPITVDLNQLLHAVVDLFSKKLTGKKLACTLDLEPGLMMVGLQGELRQVISNLLVNAIDASPSAGGRIHIRGRRCSHRGQRGVSVLIADQGSGIPAHVRHRLFSPFVTTKQNSGTGLGLWVTRGMIEKHGGHVRFRSRTDAPSGTIFRLYLPESGGPAAIASPRPGILQ